ncbi:MAG: hypothetical protein OXF03_08775 [Gammaproteobacteria bacterium]|nr:hypothetical protein [Gammaproteobacteria bacterium]
MKVGAGEVAYDLDAPPCSGVGLRWSGKELDAALNDRVAAVLFDDEGRTNIEGILAGLAETEFAQDGIRRVLKEPDRIEDWRVGEAIAETYLTDHRSCSFPWPDGRDERKRGSSLPGADLVGFGIDASGDCFVFGEVKTSSQHSYPPGAMHGRTGLKRQLEDLRDDEGVRDDLVKYLCHRAELAPWRVCFERAAGRYLRNSSDIQLYGCLIRDVVPRQDDLRLRVGDLGAACPEGTRIELLALYLPKGCLNGIGREMISRREGAEQ